MYLINERKDWALEKLGHFADYEKGKKPKNQFSKQNNILKYPYVDIQAFEKGIFNSYTDGENCRFCSEDDFLMVWDGSRSGFVGKGINGVLGSTLMKINFPGMENHFAYYFLKSKYLEINTKPKGTGTPHVNPDLLWNYIFPIAPLPEQRAIVAKIEQLFSDLDKGIASLKKAQEQLKIYRQAVLKKAFEGELTKKWREEQTDLPSAKELLQQIKEERVKRYQKQLDEWKQAVKEWEDKGKEGKKPSRPKEPKELPPLSEEELMELPELPERWCWIKVDKLLEHDQYSIKAGPFGSALKKQFYVKT
ncbi:MAG: restriction endonuclease subunit S [bacterium]